LEAALEGTLEGILEAGLETCLEAALEGLLEETCGAGSSIAYSGTALLSSSTEWTGSS